MDTNNTVAPETAGGDAQGRVHERLRSLGADWRQLRGWQRSRVATAGIAAAAAAAVVVSTNGMMTAAGAPWWSFVLVGAGSLLAGLVVGSYISAPIGAEATVCDTRWPLIGLTGLVLSTSTGEESLAAHLFTGAPPAVLAGVIQPAFALLSFALLGWALRERLGLERTAVSPVAGKDADDACTTCRPLFPTKPGLKGRPDA